MYHNPGTLSQGWYQILQNLDAILVGPIMEDGLEIVDICADRLWCEEVTTGKTD